jgi:hypothetical protein
VSNREGRKKVTREGIEAIKWLGKNRRTGKKTKLRSVTQMNTPNIILHLTGEFKGSRNCYFV